METVQLILTVTKRPKWQGFVAKWSSIILRRAVYHAVIKVELDDTFYLDFTDGGCRAVTGDDPLFFKYPEEVVYVTNCDVDLTELIARFQAEISRESKVKWSDLIKLSLGLTPSGFTCLSFSYYLLTGNIDYKMDVERLIFSLQTIRK